MRNAVLLGLLFSACTCDDNKQVVINTAPASSIADRLGFQPKGEPTALDAYGLKASAVVPAGATLERNEAGAVLTLKGLAVQLRAVPDTDRDSNLEQWIRTKRHEPRRRETDADGWLLVADAEGGAARFTVVYRARAGVLCESAPARDKTVLDEVARICLSLAPR